MAFLVLFAFIGLHIDLCSPDPHLGSGVSMAQSVNELHSCHHDDHDHGEHEHAEMLCAPPRSEVGSDLVAPPPDLPYVVVPGPQPTGRARPRSDRKRCRPGRSLLTDLCIART